eukprot:3480084-Amphidinium_carterae.1
MLVQQPLHTTTAAIGSRLRILAKVHRKGCVVASCSIKNTPDEQKLGQVLTQMKQVVLQHDRQPRSVEQWSCHSWLLEEWEMMTGTTALKA